MIDDIFVIILPIIIVIILQTVPCTSITYGVNTEIINSDKIIRLKKAYSFLVNTINTLMALFGVMTTFPKSDFSHLMDSKNTYDIISLLPIFDQSQSTYWVLLFILLSVAMLCPILYYISDHIEKKRRVDLSNDSANTDKHLLRKLIVRIMMFAVGAIVAWLSIIVLFKTRISLLNDTPLIMYMEYLIVLICLFINFRFQVKADRGNEVDPCGLGIISICCSAVWCTFVYSVFSISFLISLSTFIHINNFVVQEGVYHFYGIDCRIYLVLSSVFYAFLFIITSGGSRFREMQWYVYAFYIITVFNMFFTPMLSSIINEKAIFTATILMMFAFFYFCLSKYKTQAISQNDKSDIETSTKPTLLMLITNPTQRPIIKKAEPWSIATVIIAVVIVLAACVWPIVRIPG